MLLDRCPHCNAPIEPHRLSALDNAMTSCATCKRDLREAMSIQIESDAITFQQAAKHVVIQRQGSYGIEPLSSVEWFALSRYFVMLLRKVSINKSEHLTAFAKLLDVDVNSITSPATGLALELLPVQERSVLLAGAWRMIKAGPERFADAAKVESLTSSSLREKGHSVPRCIQMIIQTLPDKSISRKWKGKDGIPNPRSRQAVMRMWARLQRKMQVAIR